MVSLLLLGGVAGWGVSCRPPEKPGTRAVEYRLYAGDADDWHVSHFPGLVVLPPWEDLFERESGADSAGSQDEVGNRILGPVIVDGNLISAVVGPRGAVNLHGVAPDGTEASSTDVDGDGVVDLLDLWTSTGRRFTLADPMGREFLSRWAEGGESYCQTWAQIEQGSDPFGCDDATEEGSAGGPGAAPATAGTLDDPFASICEPYRGNDSLRRMKGGVFSHGGHGYPTVLRVAGFTGYWWNGEGDRVGRAFMVGIQYRFDAEGNHVSTTRETRYFDEHGDTTVTIRERVDHEGEGTRTVTDHETGRSSTRRFHTTVGEDGKYDVSSPWTDPDAPEDVKAKYEEQVTDEEREALETPWPPGEGASHPDSVEGPGLDPAPDWEAWCTATEGGEPSGLEQAAAQDPGLFDEEVCVSPESEGSGTGNCIDLASSRPMDLEAMLEPPGGGTSCGPFEEPGPDGTCGPASGLQRLLGSVAWLGAADLGDVVICDPSVCQPGFFDTNGN